MKATQLFAVCITARLALHETREKIKTKLLQLQSSFSFG
jgi:hypothetical protein